MIRDFNVPGISIDNGIVTSELCDLISLSSLSCAKKLEDLIHIKFDIQTAHDLFVNITRLDDVELNYILKYSLWFTASSLYCRCFNEGREREFRLGEAHLKKLTEHQIEIHRAIKRQRNKYMAHADKNEFEKFVVLGIPDFERDRIIGVSNVFTRTIIPSEVEIKKYIELTEDLLQTIASEEDAVWDSLAFELEHYVIDQNALVKSKNPASIDFKAQFYCEAAKRECENQNFTRGLELINQAIDLRPDVWEFFYNRSSIYKSLGDMSRFAEDMEYSEQIKKGYDDQSG